MKNFFKMLLAVILGMFIFTLVGVFIIGGMVASLSTQSVPTLSNNTILKLSLSTTVNDRVSDNPLNYFNPVTMKVEIPLGLNNILKGIERAKNDPKIIGIYMDLTSVAAGMATVEEIRNAIADFKESGKFVIAYADNYSQKAYYLATSADKVYLNPFGNVELKGISSEIMFYKGMIDMVGVDMQIIRHGKFKSAVEPFISDKMSAENREQIMTYTGSIWGVLLSTINSSRNISIDDLNKLSDNLMLCKASDAVDNNLVDKLYYKDEIITSLCKYSNAKNEDDLKMVGVNEYSYTFKAVPQKSKVAVIYASGTIISGSSAQNIISGSEMSATIRRARNDSAIKSIVIRVNSPGGDAQASEIIAREIELASKVKPVIISMGDVAASGGYWISAPANKIYANQTTITGSIGVFGMVPNFEKALKNKLGITVDVATTNKHSDFPTVFRPLNTAEKDYLQNSVEFIYGQFIAKVSKFRNMPLEAVDSIGQGRVWTGSNAYKNGLIDNFGGLRDAIRGAAAAANLGEGYSVVELPGEKTPYEMFVSSMGAWAKTNRTIETDILNKYQYIIETVNNKGIMARVPYDIEIK